MLVRNIVAVGVGETQNAVGHRDDDLVSQHADAVAAVDVVALVEDLGRLAFSIAIAVFEDENAVAALACLLAVIDRLQHPESAALVDVDTGGTEDLIFGGEQCDLEALGDVEACRNRCRPWFLLRTDRDGEQEETR